MVFFMGERRQMPKTQGRVKDIAARLSAVFQQLVPLHHGPTTGHRTPTAKEIAKVSEIALKQFLEKAREERARYGLGLIGRARVAFDLQQTLLQAGYPPPLVKQVLFAMLTSAFVGDKS